MRIVSLVPSHTETLFALGAGEDVVGVTRFCVHPEEARATKTIVGGTKDPDIERIATLAPDLVVANREENREVDVGALRARGLRVELLDVPSVDAVAPTIRALGDLVRRDGAPLARVVEEALAAANDARPAPVPAFAPIWRAPWMTVGRDTYASSVLAAVGFGNVAAPLTRYPSLEPAAAVALGASVALLPSEPYPFAEKHVGELVAAGFARERVLLIDGEALTWYGVRTAEGLTTLRRVRATLD
ncbi:MAG: helical backbone metal receptor [Thermoplasmatota archaeon]